MKTNYLSVRTFRSATTNPPINESRELTLSSNVFATVTEQYNGVKRTKKYFVNTQNANRIFAMVEELGLFQLAFDMLNQQPMPFDTPFVGGTSGTVITFMANGVQISFNSTDARVAQILAEMNNLISGGELYYEDPPQN